MNVRTMKTQYIPEEVHSKSGAVKEKKSDVIMVRVRCRCIPSSKLHQETYCLCISKAVYFETWFGGISGLQYVDNITGTLCTKE